MAAAATVGSQGLRRASEWRNHGEPLARDCMYLSKKMYAVLKGIYIYIYP